MFSLDIFEQALAGYFIIGLVFIAIAVFAFIFIKKVLYEIKYRRTTLPELSLKEKEIALISEDKPIFEVSKKDVVGNTHADKLLRSLLD